MSRYNECGCDINRKIDSSNQKGVVLQRNIVNSFQPNIIVSLHEAPSPDFLIHPNPLISKPLYKNLLNSIENKGIKLASEDYLGRKLIQPGVSLISGNLKRFFKLIKLEPLSDYAENKGILEITTESGWNSNNRFQRIESHVLFVLSLLKDHSKI